jgi:hypothetical protein
VLAASFRARISRASHALARRHRILAFNWKQHAYQMVENHLSGIARSLDAEMDLIYSLTYRRVGKHENIDTSAFRQSIWWYVLSLYGLQYDDFNYYTVNRVLPQHVKALIKKAACFPQLIGPSDWEPLLSELEDSEICHVLLLAVESKRQASILYGMRELYKYLSS